MLWPRFKNKNLEEGITTFPSNRGLFYNSVESSALRSRTAELSSSEDKRKTKRCDKHPISGVLTGSFTNT